MGEERAVTKIMRRLEEETRSGRDLRDAYDGLTPFEMLFLIGGHYFDVFFRESFVPVKVTFTSDALHFMELLRENEPLKGTAKGNLPRSFCRKLITVIHTERFYSTINSELDSPEIERLHITLSQAGLIKKHKGHFSITSKGEKFLEKQDVSGLFMPLFRVLAERVNWGYFDGFDDSGVIQDTLGFSLYLLARHGGEPRPVSFYADLLRKAFPELTLSEKPIPEDKMLSFCFYTRMIERFLELFGFIEADIAPAIDEDSILPRHEDILIKRTPLFEEAIDIPRVLEPLETGPSPDCGPPPASRRFPANSYFSLYEKAARYQESLPPRERDYLNRKGHDLILRLRADFENGLPPSYALSWVILDMRFGENDLTLCQRFRQDPRTIRRLEEKEVRILEELSGSYFTFYEYTGSEGEFHLFREILTGTTRRVVKTGESYEEGSRKGDIWYMRLVGPSEKSCFFSMPYIFPPESAERIRRCLEFFTDEAEELLPEAGKEEIAAEASKRAHPWFALNMLSNPDISRWRLPSEGKNPHSRFRVSFRVRKHQGLKDALDSSEEFSFDPSSGTWTWYRIEKKGAALILGSIRIARDRLTAETDSEKLALRVKEVLSNYSRNLEFENLIEPEATGRGKS